MTTPPFTVQSALLCDDVRREHNGKFIFIGVYAQTVRFQSFPATFPINLALTLNVQRPTETDLQFKCTGAMQPMEMGGHLRAPELGATIVTVPMLLVFDKDTVATFAYRLPDGDWQELLSIPVLIIPPST